ncbi:anion permease [Escherichia coli]
MFARSLFASLSAHTATVLPVFLAISKGLAGHTMEQLCILLVLCIGIMGCLAPYATGRCG